MSFGSAYLLEIVPPSGTRTGLSSGNVRRASGYLAASKAGCGFILILLLIAFVVGTCVAG